MEASLYVHVPFCSGNTGGKCAYCDFYSVPLQKNDPRPERYTRVVLAEGERLFEAFRPRRVPTLYIGGGTPSVLGPSGIGRLLRGLLEIVGRYSPAPPEEVSVEANPESSDEAFLSSAREGGATRLSLGVQSFYGPSREAVRRIGDEALLPGRLALAAEYFPGAFSADLITGLPGQSEKILSDDIAALLDYRPAHVSLYALTVEDGTPLAGRAYTGQRGKKSAGGFLPDKDEADRLWLAGRDALEKAGYEQYEVSNFRRNEMSCGDENFFGACRHNIGYWRMKNWLALGPAASGTVICDSAQNDGAAALLFRGQSGKPRREGTGFRYTIPAALDPWLKAGGSCFCDAAKTPGVPPPVEELDKLTLIKETILMGFRYIEGPDENLFFRRFHQNIEELVPRVFGAWRARGLLRKDKSALTKEGLLFLDNFIIDAFRELDTSFLPC